ncbi:MAG: RdgB/HAM1 family non-canonical purine NTP pyrophosphatase [bacterium]|nr:RdgB/HAM1 family non-canonical purine NTP pyrophosphatase [bacterium]
MLDRLLVATFNRGKVKEIIPFLEEHVKEIVCLADLPDAEDVEETGKTFEENAILKAETHFSNTGIITVADDSGLVVDALQGEPGVYSARYAGEGATDVDNNNKLLAQLKNIPEEERTGRFKCLMALTMPGKTLTFDGTVDGKIQDRTTGDYGFGYDPLFIPVGYERSFGELGKEVKFKISHRTMALLKVVDHIQNNF